MQFQIPQFIETEDKIVGPLTLKQALFAGGAVAASIALYFTLGTFLGLIFALPLLALGGGLAFVKVNGLPLTRILTAAFHFYWQPQTYVWQPENPALSKNTATIQSAVGDRFSLESIISGLALKRARVSVETGTRTSLDTTQRTLGQLKEKYEIFQGVSGERRAARRVDYR